MFSLWNVSVSEMFSLWNVQSLECSVSGTSQSLECSVSGMFSLWNVQSLECSVASAFRRKNDAVSFRGASRVIRVDSGQSGSDLDSDTSTIDNTSYGPAASPVGSAGRATLTGCATEHEMRTRSSRVVGGVAVLALAIALPAAQIPDVDGRPLNPFAPAGKASVIFFVATDCPISNSYAPEIQRMCREFGPRGVACALMYEDMEAGAAGARLDEAVRAHLRE